MRLFLADDLSDECRQVFARERSFVLRQERDLKICLQQLKRFLCLVVDSVIIEELFVENYVVLYRGLDPASLNGDYPVCKQSLFNFGIDCYCV